MNNIEIIYDKMDKLYGGTGSITIGSPGCGKTNAAANMCLAEKGKSIRVWRGKNTCQWTRFIESGEKIVFWLHKDNGYNLFDRTSESEKDMGDFGDVRHWDDPEELVMKLDREAINVVYVRSGVETDKEQMMFIDEWNAIFKYMLDRIYARTISVYFDEFEDMAPESKPGFYVRVTNFSNLAKEFRKNWIHFNGTVHKDTEIFWVVRNKIPWKIKMKGSKKRRDSKLFTSTLSNLKVHQAYIEDDNRFDFITFRFIGKPRNFILKCKFKK